MKRFCWAPYLHTQLFGKGKREEKFSGLIGFHRSKQMTIAKSKSDSRVKHMSWIRGNLEKKKNTSGLFWSYAYLGVSFW